MVIPNRSKLNGYQDGTTKQPTDDCTPKDKPACKFYRIFSGFKYCGATKDFKILDIVSVHFKKHKCRLANNSMIKDCSVHYLDDFINSHR